MWSVRVSPWVAGLLGALGFAGCGGTTSGGSGSSGGGQAYCAAESAWRERCKNQTCGTPIVACPPDGPCPTPQPQPCNVNNLTCDTPGLDACLARVFRPEALAQMRQCELNLECSGGREHCIEQASLPDAPRSAVEFQTACEARQTECASQSGGFACPLFTAMTDEWIAVWRACLDQPCGSIRGCQDGGKFDVFCAM